jgi:hypothetical protein
VVILGIRPLEYQLSSFVLRQIHWVIDAGDRRRVIDAGDRRPVIDTGDQRVIGMSQDDGVGDAIPSSR